MERPNRKLHSLYLIVMLFKITKAGVNKNFPRIHPFLKLPKFIASRSMHSLLLNFSYSQTLLKFARLQPKKKKGKKRPSSLINQVIGKLEGRQENVKSKLGNQYSVVCTYFFLPKSSSSDPFFIHFFMYHSTP